VAYNSPIVHPTRKKRFSRAFFLCKREVTIKRWQSFWYCINLQL